MTILNKSYQAWDILLLTTSHALTMCNEKLRHLLIYVRKELSRNKKKIWNNLETWQTKLAQSQPCHTNTERFWISYTIL